MTKKYKIVKIVIIVMCFFAGMMLYPFVTSATVTNWIAWASVWVVTSVVVAFAIDAAQRKIKNKQN